MHCIGLTTPLFPSSTRCPPCPCHRLSRRRCIPTRALLSFRTARTRESARASHPRTTLVRAFTIRTFTPSPQTPARLATVPSMAVTVRLPRQSEELELAQHVARARIVARARLAMLKLSYRSVFAHLDRPPQSQQSPCRRCQLSGTPCVFEKPEKKNPASSQQGLECVRCSHLVCSRD